MLPWNQELMKLTGCASLGRKLLFFHQYLLSNFEAKCNCESKLETTQRWTLLTSYGICQTQTLSLICQQKTQKSNLWKFRCRSSISIKRANISVISNYEKIKRQCCYLEKKKFTHHLIENPITCSNSHFWTPQFPSFTFHLSVYTSLLFHSLTVPFLPRFMSKIPHEKLTSINYNI